MHDVDMTSDDDDVEVPRYGSLKRAPPMEAVVEHKLKRLKIQRASSPDGHGQQSLQMATAADQHHEHRQRVQRQHEEEQHRQAELQHRQRQYEQQQQHYHHQLQAHASQYLTALPARYDPSSPSDVDYALSNQVLRDLHFQRELRKQMTP